MLAEFWSTRPRHGKIVAQPCSCGTAVSDPLGLRLYRRHLAGNEGAAAGTAVLLCDMMYAAASRESFRLDIAEAIL